MERIDGGLRLILILLVVCAIAVVIAQNFATIVSLLLGFGLILVIAKLLWPSPRR